MSSTVNMVFLGIGAASGAMVRYGVGLALPFSTQQFAWATFTVNILGCLLIGFLSQVIDQAWLRMLLITGFLGAFTTFSGLGFELYQYFRASQWQLLSLYALLSIIFGIFCVFLGSKCALYLQS